METTKVKALILVTLMAIAVVVPVLIAHAGGQTTYTGTNVDVKVVNDVLQPGMTYNISIIVTNKMPDTSLEKVIILTNYTADLYSNIEIISADVYNSTGDKQGQWSYEVRTYEYNGSNYTAVNAYTFPGNLALGQGDYVNITIQATVTNIPGIYQMLVIAIHTTVDYTDVVVEEIPVYIVVDGYVPAITVERPLFNGTHYVAHETTVNGNRAIFFKLNIIDTYDGNNLINLTKYPLNLDIAAYNVTTNFAVNYTTQILNDTILFVTGYIVLDNTFPEGGQVNLSVNATDLAGNSNVKTYTIVLDNTPPTVNNVTLYHADGNMLYTNGTHYFVGQNDQQIIVEVNATDSSGIYEVYVEYSFNGTAYTFPATMVNGTWRTTIDLPSNVTTGTTLIITVVVTDYALNNQTQNETIYFDLTLPTVTADVLTEGVINRFNQVTAVNANITVTDNESGFDNTNSYIVVYQYSDIAKTQLISNVTYTSWTNNSMVVSLVPGYYYEVEVHAYDNAGNYKLVTYMVVVDNLLAPNLEITVSGANYCADTGKYYTNNIVNITSTVYDIDYINATVYVNGTAIGSWNMVVPGSSFTATIDFTTYNEGVYNVTVEVVDQSGNKNSTSIFIVVDRTTPILDENATDFVAYNGTVFDPRIDGYPEIVVFTDSASPFSAADVIVYLDGTDVTANATIVVGVVNGTYYVEINVSGVEGYMANGMHNLTVIVKDCASNSKTATFTYYVDVQAPTIVPGSNGVILEYWVGEIIHLDGTVTDDYGLAKLEVAIVDGNTTIGVIAFNLTGKEFNLSDLGAINLTNYNITLQPNIEYTVVVTVYDVLGARAEAYEPYHTSTANDTIQLDNVAPAFTLVYPADKYFNGIYWDNMLPTTVEILVSDMGVGVDIATIAIYTNGTLANFTYEVTDNGVTVYLNLTSEGVFNVTIIAADTLGNANSTTYLIGVDVTPPNVVFEAIPVKGGAIITGINFNDNLSGTTNEFILKVIVAGQEFNITIPVMTLNSGYYIGILDPNGTTFEQVLTWEDLVSFIGNSYEFTFTNKELLPYIAIADGKIFLFVQYLNTSDNATLKLCIYDYAGNKGGLAINATIEKGAYYPVKLYNGWNLLSAPTVGQFTTEDVVNAIVTSGEIDIVAVYNPQTGSYDIYIPGVSNETLLLSDGVSFWVHFTGSAEGILIFQGSIPYDTVAGVPPSPLVYTIPTGGNFVGFTALKPLSVNYYLSSLAEAPVYDYIYLYNAENQIWITVPITAFDNILPGMGMWIYAYDNVALVVPTWYVIR